MTSLKYIQSRIKSITSIKKITQAMKIISSFSLKNVECDLVHSTEYLYSIEKSLMQIYREDARIFYNTLSNYTSNTSNTKATLLIVFGSDKGLCGAFNSKIINKFNLEMHKEAQILVVGNRISQYMLRNFQGYVINYFPLFAAKDNKDTFKYASLLIKEVEALYKAKQISKCRIVYTKFQSIRNNSVEVIDLLPINISRIKTKVIQHDLCSLPTQFNDNIELVVYQLIQKYLSARIFNISCHSVICEHTARMFAMENATQNSVKILKDLRLFYNRSRQSIITSELVEIISGAEATLNI